MDQTAVPPPHRFRAVDIADLRARVLPQVILLMLVASSTGAWYYVGGAAFRWRQWLVFLAATALALCAWQLRRASQLAAGLCLVLSAYALAIVAAALGQDLGAGVILWLAVLLATVLIWPWAPIGAAVGSSLVAAVIRVLSHSWAYLDLSIVAYLLTGGVLYLSMNSSYQVLQWAWNRHNQAQALAEQLRDRQEQLNRTVKALDVAYRLLQRTNHELAVAREEAEEARRLKEHFATGISHELRTPLNLILGFAELMYLSPDVYGDFEWTPLLRRDVAQIYAASRHLSQLVDDVLDLSRMDMDRMPLRRELCDLRAVVEEAVASVRGLVRDRPLTIETDLDPTIPRLMLDETRMRQVLINLLNNAVRFTEHGRIQVRGQRLAHEVLLSVSDTGSGIPPEELDKVFDEFYQVEAATRRPDGGLGLGLAISKRFVQMHGGRMWAESVLGCGSTFYVSLPLEDAGPRASRLRYSGTVPTPGNPDVESVLLLGRQSDVASLLGRHLEGYTLLGAADPDEAKQLSEQHHPRAIVHCLSLAATRGLASILLPAGLPGNVPVVFASIPCASWRAETLGVRASLRKPVQAQELAALLRDIGHVRDVLVADDDRGFVQMVMRVLQSDDRGYRVRGAYSGQEALDAMRAQPPDVLLLDLMMPGMGGTSLLSAMRASAELASIPVVVISALDVEQDVGGAQLGVVGIVQRQDWGLGDSIAALADLLNRARPGYVSEGRETPEQPATASG